MKMFQVSRHLKTAPNDVEIVFTGNERRSAQEVFLRELAKWSLRRSLCPYVDYPMIIKLTSNDRIVGNVEV